MVHSVVLPFVLVAIAFAGCVASEATTDDGSSAPAHAAAAEFDESTGGIQGLITDSELSPIVGAQVGVLKSDVITTDMFAQTDLGGRFSLSHIPPGTHVLNAQALGFESTAKRVDVLAGQPIEVNLMLVKLPSDEPFHLIDTRKAAVTAVMAKLTPQCMYNIGNAGTLAKTCQGNRLDCEPAANCEVHYDELLEDQAEAGNKWHTVTGEVTWNSQSAATGRGFMFDITAPNTTRGTGGSIDQSSPYTFFKMQPNPPIQWRIDPALLTERQIPEKDWCCDWFYRLFGGWCDLESGAGLNCETTPDVGFANANPATIYMTWFFKEPAPPGWTALPDS